MMRYIVHTQFHLFYIIQYLVFNCIVERVETGNDGAEKDDKKTSSVQPFFVIFFHDISLLIGAGMNLFMVLGLFLTQISSDNYVSQSV